MGVNTNKQKEADRLFSLWIRQSLSYEGKVMCVSCREIFLWDEVDCGHYKKRRHMGTRYNDHNAGPQCRPCNTRAETSGEDPMQEEWIKMAYGEDMPDKLNLLANSNTRMTSADYDDIIKDLRTKLKANGYAY